MNYIFILLLSYSFIVSTNSKTIYSIKVEPTSTTIGVSSSYNFVIDRTLDDIGGQIYPLVDLPSGSNISILFPTQYNNVAAYKIDSVLYTISGSSNNNTCTPSPFASSGRNLTITGCFSSGSLSINKIYVTISNIINPIPVITLSPFIGYIGNYITSQIGAGGTYPYFILTPASMTCNITFTPTTIYTNSSMIITVIPTNNIPLNSNNLLVQFPILGSWTNDPNNVAFISPNINCIPKSGSITSSVCHRTSNYLINTTLGANNAINQTFSFSISNILSPPSPQQVDRITITSLNGGNTLDICTIPIIGLTQQIITVNINPIGAMIVNQQTILQIIPNFNVPIRTSNQIKFELIFPSGSRFTFLNITLTNNQFTNFLSNQTTAEWRFSNNYNNTLFRSNSLRFSNYTAPYSTLTTGDITLNIYKNNYLIMKGSNKLTATSGTLTANIQFTPKSINQLSSYTFSIQISNPLSNYGCIQITLPTELSYQTPTICSAVGQGINSSPICSGNSMTTRICNLSNSASNITPKTINLTIGNIKNPNSVRLSDTFKISSYYIDDTINLVDTGISLGITPTKGVLDINLIKISPSISTTYAGSVSYKITFTNLNPIPQYGTILISFPNTITFTSNPVCTANINNYNFTTLCTKVVIDSKNYFNFTNLFNQSALAGGSNISFQFSSVFTNQPTTQNSSSFGIQTFDNSNYLIDELTTGIFPLIFASSLSVTIIPGNTTNSAITPYRFEINQPPPLSAGSKIVIVFPQSIIPQTGLSCVDSSGASLISCQVSGQTITAELLSNASNSNFVIVLSNIKNAPSLRQSDTFSITTFSSTNFPYSINQLQKIKNKQASLMSSSSLSGVFDPSTFGTATVFTIKVTPTSSASSILITLAQSISINSITCTPTCSSNGRILTLTGLFSGETTIVISGITAPLSFSNDRTSVATYQSTYLIDNNVNYIQFATTCAFPCRTCSSGNTSSCNGCYSLDVTEYIYYDSVNHKCVKQCQNGYFINGINCSPCASLPCATCSGTATNCTTCSSSSNYPYFNQSGSFGTCLSQCSTGMYPDSSTPIVKCVPCVGKCLTCSNSTFCKSCIEGSFLYNNECLSQCPTNKSFIPNIALRTCDPCDPNCLTCQNFTTTCLSCPLTGGYVLYLSKCVTTCTYPMIKFQGTCVNCNPSCETCSLLPNNCTTCSNSYLFNNRCLSVCPFGYTAINNICQICQLSCKTCINSTSTCTSCNSPDFYTPSLSTCSATCPTNLFKNLQTQQCVLCSSPCFTCLDSYTTCQTCLNGFIMFNNQCIKDCPNGTVTNGTHCVKSQEPNPDPEPKPEPQQIDKTLSSKIFPMPFTIAGTVIAITASISKFQNSNTFFSGATLSLLSLVQWGAYVAFLLIYAFQIGQINIFLIVLLGIFAIIYILNFIAFIAYFCILCKDATFKVWKHKKCSHTIMLIFAHVLSFIISFKFMNIIFCKLYGFSIFKAKLDSVRKFFGFNFLIFLSTPFSLGAIGVAAYYAYTNNSSIITQLYLQAIDLIIVVLFTFIFGIATSHKQQQFFQQKVGDTSLGKKGYDNDEILDSKQHLKPQLLSQFSKNLIQNQNSLMQLRNDMSNGEFQQQDYAGLQAVNPTNKKNNKSNSKHLKNKLSQQNIFDQKQQSIKEQNSQSIQQNKQNTSQIQQNSDKLNEQQINNNQQSQIFPVQQPQKDIIKSQQQQSILNKISQNNNPAIVLITQQKSKINQPQDIIAFQERDRESSRDQQNLNLSKQKAIEQDRRLASQNNELDQQQNDNQNNKIKTQQSRQQNHIYQENDDQINEDKYQDVFQQEQWLQEKGSDGLSKREKVTVKTKGLDTDKDNYITDRGERAAKQIFSDQQSDFRFGNKDVQNNKHFSEGQQVQNRIQQLDQQNDKIIPSFDDDNQIEDSLPEAQLNIQLRPYHAIPSNRKSQRLNQSRTIDANKMLNNFYQTSQMFRNISINKMLPSQEQDHKITDLKPSPNLQQAQGGHKIINKDPPKDPMKSHKNQKKNRNELLNSSSEFQASESQNQPRMFEKIEQLRRQNLTQFSKQQQPKNNKKQQPQPKKIKIVYDTSDVMDEDSMQFQQIGVSPSDFNHYNQRFVEQQFNFKTSSNPLSRNDVPLKPQIVMVKSKDKIIGKPQVYQNYQQDDYQVFDSYGNDQPQIGKVIHKYGNKPMSAVQRQPVTLRGFSSQGQRSKNNASSFFNSTSRDKRPIQTANYSKQKKPQKVNRGLQKIYLQRLDGALNNKQK